MRYLLAMLSLTALHIQNVFAAERPNIVMIFTDDQRYDAVGYAGNDAVHTPNLDRLAQQSLPDCTVAPSAEHARAYHEDEPCDDARGKQ